MTGIPVSLRATADELSLLSEEHTAFLNTRTGELIGLSQEELSAAEEENDISGYPEWQQEAIAEAREVIASDDYLPLPSQFEIHEYAIMEDFCSSIPDAEVRQNLLAAIKGRGAFRRFKEDIRSFDVEDDWHRFRDRALESIAIAWLEEHQIPYVRDTEERRDPPSCREGT